MLSHTSDVLKALDSQLNFTEIGERLGISRERVRQIAKAHGIIGHQRRWVGKYRKQRPYLGQRPPCPKCGNTSAPHCGLGPLGNHRHHCPCGRIFTAGPTKRLPIVKDSLFYSRIGAIGNLSRWNYESPLTLNYPYIINQSLEGVDMVLIVNNLVRRTIPDDLRSDVCQDILVELIARRLTIADLTPIRVESFIRAVFKQRGWDKSLESWVFGGDKTLGEHIGVY